MSAGSGGAEDEKTSADGLPPLRDVIRRHGLSAEKSLGQNFILDLNLTRRIARAAGPLAGSTVIEVGPGPGGLTRALLSEGASRVIAVERDPRCLPALDEIRARYPGRLDVVQGDARHANWLEHVESDKTKPVIAANLPYAVATTLLIGWLETEPWPPWWERMVLMFQKEVAERIVALPRTKAYGRLAVIAQWRTRPRIVMTLAPAAFTPPPKVASAVVEFLPRPAPNPPCSASAIGRVTAAAFGQRRKMLRASLKTLVANPEEFLSAAAIAPERRAEELEVREFAQLALLFERSRAGR